VIPDHPEIGHVEPGITGHVRAECSVTFVRNRRSRCSGIPTDLEPDPPVLHKVGATTVYQHLHFSKYGMFQKRMIMEAAAIAALATKLGGGLEAR